MHSTSTLARSRRRARARLNALARAAGLGGVALAALAPGAQAAPTASSADGAATDGVLAQRHLRAPDAGLLDRPVRATTSAAAAVLADPAFTPTGAGPFRLPGTAGEITRSQIAVADLDGDGDIDVIEGRDVGAQFRYFENIAQAGQVPIYAAPVDNAFGLPQSGSIVNPALVDLDADGDSDLVTIEFANGTPIVYENVGSATAPQFAAGQSGRYGLPTFSASNDYRSITFADIDADGDPDAFYGASFRLGFSRNTGTAASPQFGPIETGSLFGIDRFDLGNLAALAFGDLDGDGDLDLLGGDSEGNLNYFENTGSGTAPAFGTVDRNAFGLANIGSNSVPALVDFYGTGSLGVLAGNRRGQFFAFTQGPLPAGTQTPAFSAAQTLPFGLPDLGDAATYTEGDLDGDGDLDLVAGDNNGAGPTDGALYYFENTGTATAPAYTQRAPGSVGLDDTAGLGRLLTPDLGDVDGDGDLDLMVGDLDGDYGYYENTGTAAAPAFTNRGNLFGFPDRGSSATVELADLDGDGDTDALLGSRDNGGGGFRITNLVLLENTGGPDGPPAFAAPVTNPFGLPTLNEYHADPAVADLDGDGDLDLVVGTYYDSKTIYFVNTAGPGATPAFANPVTNAFGLDPSGNLTSPLLADLDGDGDLDALVGLADGTVEFLENDPTGTPGAAAQVGGDEGYRMLSAPADGATVDMLLGTTHTQGFPGADAENGQPTVYFYDESLPGASAFGYRTPTGQDETIGLGRGVFAYLFEDDDVQEPGVQGGFPKPLAVAGERPLVDFGWGADGPGLLTFTDTGDADADGFNLLGNPFGSWFDWDAVELTNVDAPVYVYDDAISNYRTYSQGVGAGSLPGGIVGPFQGFFVQASGADPGITARAAVSNGGPLYKDGAAPAIVGLRLRPADGGPLPAGIESEAFLALDVPGAQTGVSPLDARALTPPASQYVLLATEAASPDGMPTALAIDARPEQTAEQTVELSVTAVGATGAVPLVLDWPGLDLPAGWTAQLLDRETGTVTALADGGSYAFELGGTAARPAVERPSLVPTAAEGLTEGRFALVVTPANIVDSEDAPAEATLSQAMPNPSRGTARLALTLASPERVRAAVYDALGREVAVLADGEMQGAAELRIDTARLAAGVYVVRVEGETFAETRRLTVVR